MTPENVGVHRDFGGIGGGIRRPDDHLILHGVFGRVPQPQHP